MPVAKKKWWKAMQIAQNTQQYHQHDISIERHAEIFAHVMRSIMCVWVQTSHPKKYYKIFKSKHARRTIWWLETRFRKLASLVVVVKNLLYISSSSYYAHTVKDMMTERYCITHTDFVLFFLHKIWCSETSEYMHRISPQYLRSQAIKWA